MSTNPVIRVRADQVRIGDTFDLPGPDWVVVDIERNVKVDLLPGQGGQPVHVDLYFDTRNGEGQAMSRDAMVRIRRGH